MINKLKNFFKIESKILLRLVLIIFSGFVSVFLLGRVKAQNIKIVNLRQEKTLVEKIPQMEKELKMQDSFDDFYFKINKDFKLQGVFQQNGERSALIDDKIYKEGQECGNFTIIKIDINQVILENRTTKKRERLYLNLELENQLNRQ